MKCSDDLPLMRGLPRAKLPTDEILVLASGSPRRAQLLRAAGYEFRVQPASDEAECGMCSRETAPQLVARLAFRKAADVVKAIRGGQYPTHDGGKMETAPAARAAGVPGKVARAEKPEAGADATPEIASESWAKADRSGLIVAADTVASCVGQILGKPRNREHAESTLRLLSGRRHDVYTGICVWSVAQNRCVVDVIRTELLMQTLSEEMLEEYLESMLWEGKAGAFGYQDGNDWLSIEGGGSETNVVGLPMERFAELLEQFDQIAKTVNIERE